MAAPDFISFFPELQARQQANQKKQAMAAMLMQQGMQRDDPNQTAGGMVYRQSPLGGLAKLGDQFLGQYTQDKADEENKALAKQAQTKLFGDSLQNPAPPPLDVQPTQPQQQPQQAPQQQSAVPFPTGAQSMAAPGNPIGDKLPLGIRQNNPGNIRPSGDQWQGMTGQQNGYLTFDTPESGIRALAKNLMSYDKQGVNTINGIVNKWAPASDNNNTGAYAADLAKQLGADPNQPLNLKDPQVTTKLAAALVSHENGQNPYSPQQLQAGVMSAYGQPGQMQASAQLPPVGGMNAAVQTPQQPAQDHGLLGNMFAKNGIDQQEGMMRLMMGDNSVLKSPKELAVNDRYRVVGGQLVDLTGDAPHVVGLGGQSPSNAAQISPDVHGDDFLSQLDPKHAALVKLIGDGNEKSSTVLSRMKADEKAAILSDVAQYNPNYNARQFGNMTKFETGKEGGSIRSLNASTAHLDLADQMGDALQNGDFPLFNKVANQYATATGKSAPNNFDTVKDIAADEVVKFIIGAGGSLADREEAKTKIKNSSSPEQLKGAISAYRQLMDGQKSAYRTQYEQSTGKKDFDRLLEQPQSSSPAGKTVKWDDLK